MSKKHLQSNFITVFFVLVILTAIGSGSIIDTLLSNDLLKSLLLGFILLLHRVPDCRDNKKGWQNFMIFAILLFVGAIIFMLLRDEVSLIFNIVFSVVYIVFGAYVEKDENDNR